MLELVRMYQNAWGLMELKLKTLLANAFILGCTSTPYVCLKLMMLFIMDRMKLGFTTQTLVLALTSLLLIKLCEHMDYAHGSPTLT